MKLGLKTILFVIFSTSNIVYAVDQIQTNAVSKIKQANPEKRQELIKRKLDWIKQHKLIAAATVAGIVAALAAVTYFATRSEIQTWSKSDKSVVVETTDQFLANLDEDWYEPQKNYYIWLNKTVAKEFENANFPSNKRIDLHDSSFIVEKLKRFDKPNEYIYKFIAINHEQGVIGNSFVSQEVFNAFLDPNWPEKKD